MFISYFTERPYQDPSSGYFGSTGRPVHDLSLSNGDYDAQIGAALYNRYLDEAAYVEEVGFDGIVLNEHHSTPFCMGASVNIEAAILARMTRKVKIVLLGNILPIWDDPLWLAEQLAQIDMISMGRLVVGWVRGTGRESVAHNAQSPYNWERFQEAHDFILKTWTDPGPFRWEGQHYNYRYVNPWAKPLQKPHPPIWIPGIVSKNTVDWAATRGYPYWMLATLLEPTKQSFDYYDEVAREHGFEPGTQHRGYNFRVHVDETEELAYDTARKLTEGPGNIFLEGSRGVARPFIQNLPGMTQRNNVLPTGQIFGVAQSRGRHATPEQRERAAAARAAAQADPAAARKAAYDRQIENYSIITGTPKTVIPKIRHVLETLRPGAICFWDGDGAMTHDDAMRSLRLMGSDVLPAVREIGRELELVGPFDLAREAEPVASS